MELRLFADIIGMLGVGCVLGTYFLLQSSLIKSSDLRYSFANAIGALFIFYSLLFNWNTSSAVIEFFWFTISLYGGIKEWLRKKAEKNCCK